MSKKNLLVLEGSEIKVRIEAERAEHKTPVHVDWVRFTCFRRSTVPTFLTLEDQFPVYDFETANELYAQQRRDQIKRMIEKAKAEHNDPQFSDAMSQALDLAKEVCAALGSDFTIKPEIKNGRDFYKYQWSIERNETECGWVGFLSATSSPSKMAQDATLHVNLYGSACTFASPGWNHRIAELIDLHEANLTRADLALDFFDGLPGGRDLESVKDEYLAGLLNSGGKKLKCRMVGDWANGAERSFYIGSKGAGKETNVYEKGDQLFGVESKNPWVRIELRYGNKLRVLPSDLLRRPADFFAGASDWHESQLLQANSEFSPQKVPTLKALPVQTIEAEVTRLCRWALRVAGPTLTTLVKFATESALFEVCAEKKQKPGRLQKFNDSELSKAFQSVFDGSQVKKPFSLLRDSGTESTFSVFAIAGTSPARA
jgi:phage replication initiation protein